MPNKIGEDALGESHLRNDISVLALSGRLRRTEQQAAGVVLLKRVALVCRMDNCYRSVTFAPQPVACVSFCVAAGCQKVSLSVQLLRAQHV